MTDILMQSEEAIEELGNLVSMAGGDGDEALDVFKDAVGEVRHLRRVLSRIAILPTYAPGDGPDIARTALANLSTT